MTDTPMKTIANAIAESTNAEGDYYFSPREARLRGALGMATQYIFAICGNHHREMPPGTCGACDMLAEIAAALRGAT